MSLLIQLIEDDAVEHQKYADDWFCDMADWERI